MLSARIAMASARIATPRARVAIECARVATLRAGVASPRARTAIASLTLRLLLFGLRFLFGVKGGVLFPVTVEVQGEGEPEAAEEICAERV